MNISQSAAAVLPRDKFRQIASRLGPVKALVALEHAMLVAIWNMCSTGT